MPYDMKNPPDTIKGLPQGAQKIWVDVFNSTLAETDDENSSRIAAWGAVKTKYAKDKDGTWTAKEGTDLSESVVNVGGVKMSTKPWADVNKSDLPESCFLIVGDPDVKDTWHLPYKEKSGVVNMGAVRSIMAVMGGARGGMDFTVPQDKKDKMQGLMDKISAWTQKQNESTTQNSTEGVVNIHEDLPALSTGAKVAESGEGKPFKVWVTIIKEGWSANRRYYSADNLKQISTFIESTPESRKVFVNHLLSPAAQAAGRSLRDWAGNIEENVLEGGALRAKVHLFDEPDGKWLKERVLACPEQVGGSIDARARLSEGEREGRKGQVVDEVVGFNSWDLVVRPAAGGGVNGIAESMMSGDPLSEDLTALMNRSEENDKYWSLKSALDEAFRLIYNDDTLSTADMKAKTVKVLQDFADKMALVDLNVVFGTPKYENVKQTDKPGSGEDGMAEVKHYQDLLVAYPVLMEAFKANTIAEAQRGTETEGLKKQVADLTTQIGTLTESVKTVTKERDEAKTAVAVRERRDVISRKLADAKLPAEAITEDFNTLLVGAADEAVLNAKITERAEWYAKLLESMKGKTTRLDLGRPPVLPPVTTSKTTKTELTTADGIAAHFHVA